MSWNWEIEIFFEVWIFEHTGSKRAPIPPYLNNSGTQGLGLNIVPNFLIRLLQYLLHNVWGEKQILITAKLLDQTGYLAFEI